MSDSTKAIFLSYASQDAEAARRICDALRQAGVEVWFDAEGGLEHGDEWDAKIRRQIKECVLFIPVISAHTEAREEGYFRIEWDLAAERARGIASGVAFILPVVIDGTREQTALVPDRFRAVQWTRLPGGTVSPEVLQRFLKLWSHRTGVLKHAESRKEMEPERPRAGDSGSTSRSRRPVPAGVAFGMLAAVIAVGALIWWFRRDRGGPNLPSANPTAAAPATARTEFPVDRELAKAVALVETINSTVEDHRLAEDLAKGVLARSPTDAEAVIVNAYVNNRFILRGFDVSAERYAAARRLSERALALAPDHPEALFVMGMHLVFRGADPARAVELLRRAIALQPDRARYYNSYIEALETVDPPEAVRQAEAAVTRFPADAILRYRLALVHAWVTGKVEDYERALDETLAITPFATAAMRKAVIQLLIHQDLVAAKRSLEAVPGEFRLNDRTVFTRFMVAQADGDTAEAHRALATLPGDFISDFGRWPKRLLAGDLWRRQGNEVLARREYEGALVDIAQERAQNPNAGFLYPETWLLLRLGRREEARTKVGMIHAVATRPHRLTGLTNHGYGSIGLLLHLDERAKALELLREAVATDWTRRMLAGTFATNPDFAPWRDDAEIQALLRGTDLPVPATAWAPSGGAPPPADDKSVAVLPFANLSGDPAQEYFSDGITEEILGALARERDLRVPGRASAFAFKGKSATNAEIARALNVGQLIEGSVRRAGNRVRISVSLWRSSDARAEPLEPVEGEMTGSNIFALQEAVARAVVQRLTRRTTIAATALPTSNMEAYDLYLRARALRMRSSAPGAYQAMNQLEEVVRLDPSFAAAWAELADIAASLSNAAGGYDMSEETRGRAVFAATRAVELGPDLAEAHVARATVFLLSENDPEAAERQLAKAERLQPQGADLARMRAHVEAARDPASPRLLALVNRAVALDPENPRTLYSLGWALSRNGQYARADELLRRSASIGQAQSPFTAGARNWIAWTGELEEGIRRAEACPENYRNEIFYRLLAPWHEQRGDWSAARAAWEKSLELARAEVQRPGIRTATATILTELGAHAARAGDATAAQRFFAEARDTLEAVSREQPDSQHLRMRWARWHQAQGDWPAARAALAAAEGLCRSVLQRESVAQAKAELLAATGAQAEAIAILRAAHERGWAFGYTLRHNAEIKPLHGRPEFQQLLLDAEARADAHPRPKT